MRAALSEDADSSRHGFGCYCRRLSHLTLYLTALSFWVRSFGPTQFCPCFTLIASGGPGPWTLLLQSVISPASHRRLAIARSKTSERSAKRLCLAYRPVQLILWDHVLFSATVRSFSAVRQIQSLGHPENLVLGETLFASTVSGLFGAAKPQM